ncbi:MAG: hypothetical protein GYB21_02295 [Oceanospirillales bacterium]|nr:hypothetical protein [Oceanospirillales bacterium]
MPDGTGVIRLKSSAPIKEPFLNFLVEVNWPAGRLVREYTLLLDPPVFDPTPVPGVTQVQQAESTAARMPSPTQAQTVPSAAPARSQNVSNIKTRMNPNDEVYVDVHDTLWDLALKHRPNSQVTPEQMMLALVRKNPESFPSGNINVMKAGTVMRLPTLDEINSLTPAQARAEAARQTQVWRQGRASTKQTVKPADKKTAGGAEESGKPAEPAKSEQMAAPVDKAPAEEAASQLKVVTPEGGVASAAQSATADDTSASDNGQDQVEATAADQSGLPAEAQALVQRNEELENRLLVTQESISVIERENTELNDKIDAIASQMDKLQRLIELKDRELAAMQQQLNQKEAAAESGGGFIDKLMQSPAYLAGLGAAGVAVLLGLLLAMRRKKSNEPEQADETVGKTEKAVESESDAMPELAAAAVATGVVAEAVSDSKVEKEPEEPVSEAVEQAIVESEGQDDIDDLDLDLDMDMELDLDESASPEPASHADTTADEEFDLGIDELDETVAQDEESLDSALDDILAGGEESESDDIDTGLDDLLAENAAVEELDDDLPGPLDLSDEQDSTSAEAGVDEDSIDELDFSIDTVAMADDSDDELLDLPDDLEFDLAKAQPEADDVAEAASVTQEEVDADDELTGLDFSVDTPKESHEETVEDDFLDDFFAEDAADKKEGLGSLPETSEADVEPLTDEPVEFDMEDPSVGLGTVDVTPEEESFEVDDDLEEMLQSSGFEEEEEPEAEKSAAPANDFDDLDAMLASFEPEEEEPVERKPSQSEMVEEELTANIAHDLEMDLDAELDSLLSSTDDEIALEEDSAEESADEPDLLDSMNLLDGADEIETKLDLARAYIEMDDSEGARDILSEILNEGNNDQRREAERLLGTLS